MRRADDDQGEDARNHRGAAGSASGRGYVIDPDVDLHDPAQRAETRPREWDLLVAMAVGGVVGAEARYGVSAALPHGPDTFPWATVLVNASGCLLIGVLMVVLLELARPHRLWRPFLGVGVLGGYTTYSTFAVDARQLIDRHSPGLALAYIVVTFAACLVAVWLGLGAARVLVRTPRPAGEPGEPAGVRR